MPVRRLDNSLSISHIKSLLLAALTSIVVAAVVLGSKIGRRARRGFRVRQKRQAASRARFPLRFIFPLWCSVFSSLCILCLFCQVQYLWCLPWH